MILVLTNRKTHHKPLLDWLAQQIPAFIVFETIQGIQQWLDTNHEPSGLLADCASQPQFEEFVVRFTLQYADTPAILLTKLPLFKRQTRLHTFIKQVTKREQPKHQGRILFVDDSKTMQLRYRKVLESAGYSVDTADNAEHGLKLAITGRYDLAVIDYFMPGDSGADLCRKLGKQEETSDLVRAILTAQYHQGIVDECLNSGAVECMFKNESTDLFLSRVKALYRSVQRRLQVDKERARLTGLLQSVPEGVFGVTPDGTIQFVNPAAIKLLGRSVVDLLGQSPHEYIHPVDTGGKTTAEDLCFLQQAYMLSDELREWRTLFTHADGSLFPVECNVTPIGDSDTNEGSVVVFRDISEQQRVEQNWLWQLSHDHLTGLMNRSAFEEALASELSNLKRLNDPSLLLFIDLDKFKQINDQLGHAAGDQLLITLAEQLKSLTRTTDHVARLSGDEFAVLMSGIKNKKLDGLLEKYRELFETSSLDWEGEQYQVTGSIGAILLDKKSGTLTEMLAKADNACQQAKQKGRNQWVVYTDSTKPVEIQGDWHNRLTTAIKDNLFILLRQPVFSAANVAEQVGDECLSRIQEDGALVTPSLFMSNALRCGVTSDIDELLLQLLIKHCQQIKPTTSCWFSINVSVETIADAGFRERLPLVWKHSGFSPSSLMIEISETELFKLPGWKKTLMELQQYGFKIALDHFGMNTNTILSLGQMPVDVIKLDTSLTRTLATDLARRNLIDAIVATAKLSNIGVIACHIESESDLELVQARGVDFVQGYYLGKPSQFG